MTARDPWNAILTLWFGDAVGDPAAIPERNAFWFGGKAESESARRDRDALLLREFGALTGQAARGELVAWPQDPHGRLAAILLLDQLPRNLHRGTARAFATDEAARRLAEEGLALGHDAELAPIERVFFYMPLEHAEDRGAQERSVALFDSLAAAAPSGLRPRFGQYAWFAREHRDIIERFGRFPHRNALLGRESSTAERAYLADASHGFGQTA